MRATRRAILSSAAIAAPAVFAACGTSTPPPAAAVSSAAGTVEFWYGGLGQAFIDAYGDMAKTLNQKNPKITVNIVSAELPDKIVVAAAGGTPPDSFNIQLIDALTFFPKGLYEPLDAQIKTRKYDLKALWPGLAEQYQYQGKQMALWSQVTTTVTHYNVDLLKQNALPLPSDLYAQNKWTWETALDTAQKLTKEGQFGFWTLTTPQSLQPWLWMNGGAGFDNDEKPTKVTMATNPNSLAAMQWQADIRNRFRVAPTPRQVTSDLTNTQVGFANGKLAMYTEQSSFAGVDDAVKKAGNFKWDIAPLPAGPKGTFGFIGGQSVGVTTGAKAKDAAMDWVFWVTSPDGHKELVRRQIGVPVIKSMLESPDWKNSPVQPPHVGMLVDIMGKARPIAKSNQWRTLATNAFNDNITKMNNGDISAREACQQIDDQGTKVLQSGG